MIEVKHLVKKYGEHLAVDDLSFTIEPGKIYGFLGPNGAGKSTTMNIMTGYIGATSGQVLIDGHDIFEEPMEAKRNVGYLPEIPPLYVDMTVDEYLMFGAKLKKIPKKNRTESVEEVKELAGLASVENRLIKNLSKGYRQRVGIAYAVLGLPDIIILDEPTVGLDPKQIIEIRELIKKLSEKHTVILSSHILSEVSAVCDYVLIISEGKLVASDTIDNLNKLMEDTNELKLKFKCDEERVRAFFESMSQISDLVITHEGDYVVAHFQYDGTDQTIEDISLGCATNKLIVYGMDKITKSLEDLFLEVTSGDKTEETDDNEPVSNDNEKEDEK